MSRDPRSKEAERLLRVAFESEESDERSEHAIGLALALLAQASTEVEVERQPRGNLKEENILPDESGTVRGLLSTREERFVVTGRLRPGSQAVEIERLLRIGAKSSHISLSTVAYFNL